MTLYVNGSHNGPCAGSIKETLSTQNATAFNCYKTAYGGFDGCLAKEKTLSELLTRATK